MTADNWPEEIERIAAAYPDNQDVQLLVSRLREVTKMLHSESEALTEAYEDLINCYKWLDMLDKAQLLRQLVNTRKAGQ